MPLYKPDPTIGEDDGSTIQSLTESLVRLAERCKDYDESGNAMLLPAIRGLAAIHRKQLETFERKVRGMQDAALRKNAKAVKRATRPMTMKDPFRLLR